MRPAPEILRQVWRQIFWHGGPVTQASRVIRTRGKRRSDSERREDGEAHARVAPERYATRVDGEAESGASRFTSYTRRNV